MRGGCALLLVGRPPRFAPGEVRGRPVRRACRGGPLRRGHEVEPADGDHQGQALHPRLHPADAHAGTGHRHAERLDLPDFRQQGARLAQLPQERSRHLGQEVHLVLVRLRLDGAGRLRPDHGGELHAGRLRAPRAVAGLPEHRYLHRVGRHRRDRVEADDLRLQGRFRAVRPGPEAHRPRGHSVPHAHLLHLPGRPLRGHSHGLLGPDVADDARGRLVRRRLGAQDLCRHVSGRRGPRGVGMRAG
mmetsp:Transcript_128796/g.400753  ORF Transcript_128796/g.400753 Transcript_128796/m.400753 type:complete len:245 (-) Transcript_128796:53-787(-)